MSVHDPGDQPATPANAEAAPLPERPIEAAIIHSSTPDASTPDAAEKEAPHGGVGRRAFLKAAAIGAALTGMLVDQDETGRLRLGGRSVLAHVPTGITCRANDVRVQGFGRIINEDCNCTGTFNAEVEFDLINNTNTDRYCITLHLCDGRDADGNLVYAGRDIILGTLPPGSSTITAILPNYPCGEGMVCFGGPIADGRTSCPVENDCCSVVTWAPNAPKGACVAGEDPVPSKCRLQQICIVGRGATLACVDDPNDANDSCTPACGGTATLRMCVQGGTPPYTYHLNIPGDVVTFGPTNDVCHDFKVTVEGDTTYSGSVVDAEGCAQQTNLVMLSAVVPTVTLQVTGGIDGTQCCNTGASVTFKATPANCTGTPQYTWTVDGQAAAGFGTVNGDTFQYTNNPDGQPHVVAVTVTCSGCTSAPAQKTITQCIHSVVNS